MYKELVEFIVKSIVDHPDDVEVREIENRNSVMIEISVASDDTGRVIGKGGRVINAIRTVVQAQNADTRKRVSLELI